MAILQSSAPLSTMNNCISLAWYTMIRPSTMIVERLIRHFRAKEYSDALS